MTANTPQQQGAGCVPDGRRTRMLPRRSTVDSVWLNMSRSASALAPSPSPILHHPTFSVSTCSRGTRAHARSNGLSTSHHNSVNNTPPRLLVAL